MKRLLRRLLLIVLVLVELWLLTAFLPNSWQEWMYTRLEKVWPSHSYDYSRVTHPALEQELRPFEPLGMVMLGTLAIINGWAIVVLWNPRNGELT
jgi:hypothetical protein